MKLSKVILFRRTVREHFDALRARDPHEQEAEIHTEFTKFRTPSSYIRLDPFRYSLPLERIAELGIEHGYRYTGTVFGSKSGIHHNFELVNDKLLKRDEQYRAKKPRSQEAYASVWFPSRSKRYSFLRTVLLDTNRLTLTTQELDAVARHSGFGYSHTTEPVNGCSWHVFERIEP